MLAGSRLLFLYTALAAGFSVFSPVLRSAGYDIKELQYVSAEEGKAALSSLDYSALSGNPLIYIASNRSAEAVGVLIPAAAEAGADIRGADGNGTTPLIAACRNADGAASLAAVKALISLGADVSERDGAGRPPLLYALLGGNIEVMKTLLASGANPDSVDDDGYTPLMFAVRMQDRKPALDAVSLLLSSGADCNRLSNDGRTALFYAAKFYMRGGGNEVLAALVNAGARLSVLSTGGETQEELINGSYPGVSAYLGGLEEKAEKARRTEKKNAEKKNELGKKKLRSMIIFWSAAAVSAVLLLSLFFFTVPRAVAKLKKIYRHKKRFILAENFYKKHEEAGSWLSVGEQELQEYPEVYGKASARIREEKCRKFYEDHEKNGTWLEVTEQEINCYPEIRKEIGLKISAALSKREAEAFTIKHDFDGDWDTVQISDLKKFPCDYAAGLRKISSAMFGKGRYADCLSFIIRNKVKDRLLLIKCYLALRQTDKAMELYRGNKMSFTISELYDIGVSAELHRQPEAALELYRDVSAQCRGYTDVDSRIKRLSSDNK